MKFIITVLFALGLLVVPDIAHAEDGDCLYRMPFRRAASSALTETPQSRWYTHQDFGGYRGEVLETSATTDLRVYRGCGGGRAWISYQLDSEGVWRVDSTAFTMEYFFDGLTTEHPA